MVERICSSCQHGNALENRFCGHCGAALEARHALPDGQQPAANLALSGAALPTEFKQVGKAVAVSLAALAAEASLAWLRRRVERINLSASEVQHNTPTTPTHLTRSTASELAPVAPTNSTNKVTVLSQRVVQTWEQGTLTRQTIERSIWQRDS